MTLLLFAHQIQSSPRLAGVLVLPRQSNEPRLVFGKPPLALNDAFYHQP